MAKPVSDPDPSRRSRRRSEKTERVRSQGDIAESALDAGVGAAESPTAEPVQARPGDGVPATTQGAAGPHADEKRTRFRIFIIDSGWNSAASTVLHANMPVLFGLTSFDEIYVLDHAMSVSVLREHRDLIGRDPIISVHDLWALSRHGHKREHGFRIHLGLLRTEDKVLAALQMFAHFIANFRLSADLETEVHRRLRKVGIAGAIEIIGSGSAHTDLLD
jgi:hypothetical protein